MNNRDLEICVTEGHSYWYYSKAWCGFLFAFHIKYCLIFNHLHRPLEIWLHLASVLILVENHDFFKPLAFDAPVREGVPRRNIAIQFGMEKLEWWCYPMVKKTLRICVTV